MMLTKKVLLFGICSFLILSISGAQDAQFRVVSCSGSVEHKIKKEKDNKDIVPGNSLRPVGKLVLGKDSKMKIISSERSYILDKKGKYDLKKLYSEVTPDSMSNIGELWSFIMGGLCKSDSKEDLAAYHNKYMSLSDKNGYSPKDSDLQINSPISGKIDDVKVHLKWTNVQVKGNYDISIQKEDGSEMVMTLPLKKGEHILYLDKFGIEKGEIFHIQVTDASGQMNTVRLEYTDLDIGGMDRKLNNLVNLKAIEASDKDWMEAVLLEMDGYNTNAMEKYESLNSENPSNGYIKKLYQAFLVRADQMKKLSLVQTN